MRAPRWRSILVWAIVGTIIGVGLCLYNLSTTEDTLGGFVAAVPHSPLDDLQRQDGVAAAPAGGGHDGSQFYAIARDPFDYTALSQQLDRPRYRMQRILFPLVAKALHPVGVGSGLVWTMFGVLVAGLLLGSISTGVLTHGLGGPTWPAALFAPLLGSILSVRIATPDALAVALVLTSLALSLHRRPVAAVLVAVLAVLTREPTLVLLAGFAWWRRDRQALWLVGVPAAAAAAWWLWLAVNVPGPLGVSEFVVPLTGWRQSITFWLSNVEGPLGFLSALAGLILATFALLRTRPTHPLWWPLVLSCGLLALYSADVLAPERNASRVFLPIQIMAIIALTTRGANRANLLSSSTARGEPAQVRPTARDRDGGPDLDTASR